MSMIFFTYRAATQARLGAEALRTAGLSARVDRTPSRISYNGCGYGVWTPASTGREAAELLRRSRPYMRSYEFSGGSVREVRL